MTTWTVQDGTVFRYGAKIACISKEKGKLRWDGMGMYRTGFSDEDSLLEDVKYFYRYPSRRETKLTFASGRQVIL